MTAVCPDCRAAVAAPAGRTVPCPRCGNPVVGEAETAPQPIPSPPAGPGWAMIAFVLAAYAALHLGVYLWLSAGARDEVRAAEARFSREELRAAADARPEPAAGETLPQSLRRERLAETAAEWQRAGRHVNAIGGALLASLLLQTGLIVVLRIRWARARRSAFGG